MALPLRLIWNLRINKKQKFALAVMFSLGCIIILFAVIRVIQIRASTHHVDPVWLALWSMIEASVGMSLAMNRQVPFADLSQLSLYHACHCSVYCSTATAQTQRSIVVGLHHGIRETLGLSY